MAIEETLLIKLIIDIQQSIKAVTTLKKQFEGLSAIIKTTFTTASNESANNFAQSQQKVADSTKKLTDEIKKQQKQFDATKFPEGSYRQLNAQLKESDNRLKLLSATERNSAFGQALQKDVLRLKNQLKSIDAGLGDFQRNVGNYGGGLRGFFKELNANLKTVGLGGAIRNLPNLFGIVQGAIVAVNNAMIKLGDIFSVSARSSRLLAEAQDSVVSSYVDEKSKLEATFGAALNDKATKEQRAAAIAQINNLYGSYLPNQLTEASNNLQIAEAQRIANAAIIENIVQEQKAALVKKALKDAITADIELKKQDALANQQTTGTFLDFFDSRAAAIRVNKFLAESEAKTTKAVAANAKGFEASVRGTLTDLEKLGLSFKDTVNPEADSKTAGAFEQLSQEKSRLEGELKNLIVTGGKSSETLARLRIVSNQLADAEKKFAAATRESETGLERLNRRKSELETQIKNLAIGNNEYIAQQKELATINEQLAKADAAVAKANEKAQNNLERLTSRQKELNDQIQNAIANDQPYTDQLTELIGITSELTAINQEYADVQAQIDAEINKLTTGSLADYDKRLQDLAEQQKNLNINSVEYAQVTAQIKALETERSTILDSLALDLVKVAQEQAALDSQLTDQQAQNAALENARQRLAKVNSATEQGAAEIKQINQDLQNDLQAIEDSSLQRKLNSLTGQLDALKAEKDAELQIVQGNAQATAAIEAKFNKQTTDIQLQQAVVQGEILKKQVDVNSQAQEQITDKAKTEAEKRKAIEGQVLDAIGQATSSIFQAISQAQQQIADNELQQVEAERDAAIKKAEFFGASEEAKQKIQQKFDDKRAEVEKDAAERQKTIALSQAAIDIALSVLKASASAPPPANLPAIAIASILGAIQLAIIASQKFALGALFDIDTRKGFGYFAKGAYLQNGAYHSQGGMPILNPFTGQKVAEIEKGEAIINRKNTSRFYDELSFINSFRGNGNAFPNARKMSVSSFKENMKIKGQSYGFGGTFANFNSRFLKLQSGAIVAADINRQVNSRVDNSLSDALLKEVNENLKAIIKTNQNGFGSNNKMLSDILTKGKIEKDGKAAR